MYWQLHVPDDAELVEGRGGGFEAMKADATSLAWEKEFLDLALNTLYDGLRLLPLSSRSFSDLAAGAVLFDGYKMIIGYSLMFAFTVSVLGRFNKLELRIYLSFAGIFGVFCGYVIALAVTSLCAFPSTPLTILLPFVLLGNH